MSYTPTNWQTGDIVTAQKLNNIETGISNAANPFIVTLTPTALDYSGTMDKTVAEIYAAYQAGKRIVFSVSNSTSTIIVSPFIGINVNDVYPSFNAHIIMNDLEVMIYAFTGVTDNGSKNTYSTKIYSLTPLS